MIIPASEWLGLWGFFCLCKRDIKELAVMLSLESCHEPRGCVWVERKKKSSLWAQVQECEGGGLGMDGQLGHWVVVVLVCGASKRRKERECENEMDVA